MSINRVFITGNLTRDPELRRTQSGTSVLGFCMVVNDRRHNAETGKWEDHANFIDCTLFGKRAEALSDILEKGAKVAIEGRLRWSQWEHSGQKRSKLDVVAENVELMSRKGAVSEPAAGEGPDTVQVDPDID